MSPETRKSNGIFAFVNKKKNGDKTVDTYDSPPPCRPIKMQLHDLSFLRFDAAGENTVEDRSAFERKDGSFLQNGRE
jgi:hypothetical protein